MTVTMMMRFSCDHEHAKEDQKQGYNIRADQGPDVDLCTQERIGGHGQADKDECRSKEILTKAIVIHATSPLINRDTIQYVMLD
ncbi:hypothetical protein JW872_03090 [Candidatus Babeliales bacterium]|nr:hypothetical protein [Candidatus Babeliales bacterium]